MGGSSSQTIGQRYFAKLTTFIGNPIEKLIGINFDNRGWIFKPDNDETFLRVESPNLYGDKEGGVAGFIDIHTGTADQLPNATYSADFPRVSGYPFQSYLLFRGLGKKPATSGGIGQFTQGSPKHYNGSFYHGNSGYMKEMLLWPQRVHVRNDGRPQWYDEKAAINSIKIYRSDHLDYGATSFSVGSTQLYSEDGVNFVCGVSGSTGYGGVENQGISETLHQITTPADVNSYNLLEYKVLISGEAAAFEIEPIGEFLEFSFQKSVDENNNSTSIEVTALVKKKGSNFPYISVKGTGTVFNGATNSFYFQIASSYKAVDSYHEYQTDIYDINPVHKIRELLTDDTAMNKPEADVNDANFKKAADVLFDEKIGISWSVTEKSCLEAINELCGHIEAGVRINRQTGLYEMVLFRDEWFSEDQIHTLPFNKIKSMQLDGAVSADELINKLNVSYYNREVIKNSSFSVAENASIRNLNGHENSEEVKFPYFMNQRNAVIVAQWKLKQMSTPVWQGTFTTGFYEARKWNRYDLLKLAWPRKWNGTILVRIMKINLGTGTEVSIDFVEVVPYSTNLFSNIVIDTPIDTSPKPPQPATFHAFELSYLEAVQLNGQKAVDDALAYNPDAGYVAVIAKRPQSNSLSALMYTEVGNDYERVASVQYSETAELDQQITQTDTAFLVKNVGGIDMVNTGTQITLNSEIMIYQSYDEETGILTVKRGALDTIPHNHLADSVLYFADDSISVDPTEYVVSEIVGVKALSTTPSGILSLDDVNPQQVEIVARAIRPYPPANVKIDDAYYPMEYAGSNIVLTWVNRNRLQQTGGEIIGWFESGVTPEADVTYQLEVYEVADDGIESTLLNINVGSLNTYTIELGEILETTIKLRIKLFSIRSGYASYQAFEHTLATPLTPPRNLTAIFEV